MLPSHHCRRLINKFCNPHVTHCSLIVLAKPNCIPHRHYHNVCNCLGPYDVEDVWNYDVGGFRLTNIGDTLKDGRYHILHKLGYGTCSTNWLARDQKTKALVSLNIAGSNASKSVGPLAFPRHRKGSTIAAFHSGGTIPVRDGFPAHSPNGKHTCLTAEVGGPSISEIAYTLDEQAGTRRLMAPMARSVSHQLAQAVCLMHKSNLVHGGTLPNRRPE